MAPSTRESGLNDDPASPTSDSEGPSAVASLVDSDILLPLEEDEDSAAEVIVASSLSLGHSPNTDEWAFAAGLEVVESFRGTFEAKDRNDTWTMDDPSEEVARGVAWAASQSSGSVPVVIEPHVASTEGAPPVVVANQVLGAMAVLGSGGLVAAAAAVLLVGVGIGVIAGATQVLSRTAEPVVEQPEPVVVVAPPVEPERPYEPMGPEVPDDLGDEPEPELAVVTPVRVQPEPEPEPEQEPEVVAAPEPEPEPPPPDAGPAAPEEPTKRGLFGKRKKRK